MKKIITIENDDGLCVSEVDNEGVILSSVLEEIMEFKNVKEAEEFANENLYLDGEGYGSKFEIVKIEINFESNTIPYRKTLKKLN